MKRRSFFRKKDASIYNEEKTDIKEKEKGGRTAFVLFLSLSAVIAVFVFLAAVGKVSVSFTNVEREDNTAPSEISLSYEDADSKAVLPFTGNDSSGGLTLKEIIRMNKPAVVGVVSGVYKGTSLVGQNTGSGIIMSEDGYIITNDHVIEDSFAPSVVLYDGREFTATVVGRDERSDLAVLKIESDGLPFASFGDSDSVEEGDLAVAIGNPMGLELSGTVTAGIISAVNRDLTINDRIMTLIQTDASINPGNSGGPLINKDGLVIGINSVKIASSEVEGLGFAIPINYAMPIIEDLISDGYVKNRPVIGISGRNISQSESDFYGIPRGVLVDSVSPDGYAGEAGLRAGDVIISINGRRIGDMSELNHEKEKHKAGDVVTLGIWRNGNERKLSIKLAMEKNS